jgi:hypothetical protein
VLAHLEYLIDRDLVGAEGTSGVSSAFSLRAS